MIIIPRICEYVTLLCYV